MTALTAYIDFKSAESYLAFHRTITIAKENNLEIIWSPFLTNNRIQPSFKNNETKGETHLRIREEHKRLLNLKYAKILGLPMRYPTNGNESDLALSILPKIIEDKEDYIALAFQYFWVENRNLNDKSNVIELLEESKKDTKFLDDIKGLIHALIITTDQAKESGIIATPTYELQGELFLGREHLPWIKEQLSNNLQISEQAN